MKRPAKVQQLDRQLATFRRRKWGDNPRKLSAAAAGLAIGIALITAAKILFPTDNP